MLDSIAAFQSQSIISELSASMYIFRLNVWSVSLWCDLVLQMCLDLFPFRYAVLISFAVNLFFHLLHALPFPPSPLLLSSLSPFSSLLSSPFSCSLFINSFFSFFSKFYLEKARGGKTAVGRAKINGQKRRWEREIHYTRKSKWEFPFGVFI